MFTNKYRSRSRRMCTRRGLVHNILTGVQADRHTYRHLQTSTNIYRQTHRQTERQACVLTDRHLKTSTDRQTSTSRDRQTNRQTSTSTDRETSTDIYRQTDRQTDRQTNMIPVQNVVRFHTGVNSYRYNILIYTHTHSYIK